MFISGQDKTHSFLRRRERGRIHAGNGNRVHVQVGLSGLTVLYMFVSLHVKCVGVVCSLRIQLVFPLGLPGIQEVHGVPSGDEEHRDDDQNAKVLWSGCGDNHDEMQQVHEVVHGALDSVDYAPLRLTDILLQELGHSQVKGPQACMWATNSSGVNHLSCKVKKL